MSDNSQNDLPSTIQQQQLVRKIAGEVVASQDVDWDMLRYEVSALVGYKEDLVQVVRKGSEDESAFPPEEVIDDVNDLRTVMYRPGAGTWLSAVITVTSDGKVSAEFNYDEPPPWETEPAAEAYAQDVRKFPRDKSAIPLWLRERLAEAASEASRHD